MGANLKLPPVRWRCLAAMAVLSVCAAAFSGLATRDVLRSGVRWRIRNSIVGYVRQESWLRSSPMVRGFLGMASASGKGRVQCLLEQRVLQCLATASGASVQKAALCYALVAMWKTIDTRNGTPAVFVDWVAARPSHGSVLLYSRGAVDFRYSFPLETVLPDGGVGAAGYPPRPGVLFGATAPLWCPRMRAWLRAGRRGAPPPPAQREQLAMIQMLRAADKKGTLRAALVQHGVASRAVTPMVDWPGGEK